MTNVHKIVKAYLIEHGYDGLCDDECGCGVDDLMTCGNYSGCCVPGYRVPCDCGAEECGWAYSVHVLKVKP